MSGVEPRPGGGVTAAPFGMTGDGRPVQVFTLENEGGLTVRVLDLGGIVAEVNAPDRWGRVVNVVPGLPDVQAYEAQPTVNGLVGRYANRLRGGFAVDGAPCTPKADGRGVTMHGGSDPYGARVWDAEPIRTGEGPGLRLRLVSPDGDQGFPGELHVAVTYTLTRENELRLDFGAQADRATVATLTNHFYLNLAGSGPVHAHQLQVMADEYLVTDGTQVPTGDLASVAGTPLDFRQPVPVGAGLNSPEPLMLVARGYDHHFVLRRPPGEARPLAARVSHPDSGRVVEVRTTEPGLQLYSGNDLNGALVTAAGHTLRQGDALALETQHFPDSPNHPHFPSTRVTPDHPLRSTTVFRFTTDRPSPPR